MIPPRPHLGRLTVAAAALALALAGCGHSSSAALPDETSPASDALAAPPPTSSPVADTAAPDPASPTPTAPQPKTLGDDPVLDDLWHRCEQGSGVACDQLFQQAPLNSDYETFGLTCGDRPDVLRCTQEMDAPPTTVPPPTLPAPAPVPVPVPVPAATPAPSTPAG